MQVLQMDDEEESGSTQLRLATACEAQMKGNFVWCQIENRWYVKQNPSGVFYPESLEEVSAIVADVVFTAKPEATSATVRAVKELVKIPLAVKPSQFNSNPWYIATNSGVLDLQAKTLLTELPEGTYITKVAPHEWDPDAQCDRWLDHLDVVFDGNGEMIHFFQKHMGAALIGDILIKPQVFIFLQGQSGGGKGVTTRTLSYVLGDYAADFDSADFTAKGSGRHSQWKTRFNGCRLAFVNEVKSEAIDVSLLKSLSGGDRQVAHGMRENDVEWIPTQTLVFTSNVRPNFDGDTSGMSRRYLPLPTGPTRKPTPGYEQTLQSEASGILAWLVDGLEMWQEEDGAGEIPIPDRVAELRDAHIIDNDPMQVFVNTCLTIMDRDGSMAVYNTKVSRRDLREAYKGYIHRTGDLTTILGDNDPRWNRLWDILDNEADSWRASNERGWRGIEIREDRI
jgi:P4 family phage/plasmid primase-like protien